MRQVSVIIYMHKDEEERHAPEFMSAKDPGLCSTEN